MTLPPLPPPPSRRADVLLPDTPETVAQLRERHEAALRIHQKRDGELLIHGGRTRPYCSAEGAAWPCATVRALQGDDEDGES